MVKNSWVWLAVFLCLVATLSALDAPTSNDLNAFNPNNPSVFDYTNGDYSTITDWSKADWNQVRWENIPWGTTSSNSKFWESIPIDKVPDIPEDKINNPNSKPPRTSVNQ